MILIDESIKPNMTALAKRINTLTLKTYKDTKEFIVLASPDCNKLESTLKSKF